MSSTRRERALTREEMLDAALHVVDAEGLQALTMRRLAREVGVEAMSLYHHVPNKEVLLDWTVERMRSEIRLPDPLPEDWVSLMATVLGEYRRVLASHPNMMPLAARRTGAAAPMGLRYLVECGFPVDDAVELYQSLVALTVGYSMLSAAPAASEMSPLPDELAAWAAQWRDETCERALRLIMDGYKSRRDAIDRDGVPSARARGWRGSR